MLRPYNVKTLLNILIYTFLLLFITKFHLKKGFKWHVKWEMKCSALLKWLYIFLKLTLNRNSVIQMFHNALSFRMTARLLLFYSQSIILWHFYIWKTVKALFLKMSYYFKEQFISCPHPSRLLVRFISKSQYNWHVLWIGTHWPIKTKNTNMPFRNT